MSRGAASLSELVDELVLWFVQFVERAEDIFGDETDRVSGGESGAFYDIKKWVDEHPAEAALTSDYPWRDPVRLAAFEANLARNEAAS